MGALILDANVLIGLLDSADAHHERAVADVEAADTAGQELIAPASAYSAVLVAFAREGRTAEAREALAAMGIRIEPLTAQAAEDAAELRAHHKHLRLPDAMVLACAIAPGRSLLTYDNRRAYASERGSAARVDVVAQRSPSEIHESGGVGPLPPGQR